MDYLDNKFKKYNIQMIIIFLIYIGGTNEINRGTNGIKHMHLIIGQNFLLK
jgi:hypothetical protein